MTQDTVRGMYCLRCSSRRVVRGKIGEAARFYPARAALKAMFAKPVFLSHEHSHACLDCGLAWAEVDRDELRKNLRKWGLVKHSTVVMDTLRQ